MTQSVRSTQGDERNTGYYAGVIFSALCLPGLIYILDTYITRHSNRFSSSLNASLCLCFNGGKHQIHTDVGRFFHSAISDLPWPCLVCREVFGVWWCLGLHKESLMVTLASRYKPPSKFCDLLAVAGDCDFRKLSQVSMSSFLLYHLYRRSPADYIFLVLVIAGVSKTVIAELTDETNGVDVSRILPPMCSGGVTHRCLELVPSILQGIDISGIVQLCET
ncbi:hypothetical protein F5050DRAFT_170473 [Lentinula boryana]|uniref:Uncharacterized protein n=1 Tax=Lentinula boryana TaxID=40481 RepID=A0ABQ8QCI0_9AGAR|nr:hypothetical protein F5050DRAFT_170473 [Lentinula boryana]